MKQGENITEKIFRGKNNELILETRRVEVFKSPQPKSKALFPIKLKKSKRYDKHDKHNNDYKNNLHTYLEFKKKGENITEKILPGNYNTLIAEKRKVEVFKYINKRKHNLSQFQTFSNDKRRVDTIKNKGKIKYTGMSSEKLDKSKSKDINPELIKRGEKLTEKIFPGNYNTLVSEIRKVEVYKNKRKKRFNYTTNNSKEKDRINKIM